MNGITTELTRDFHEFYNSQVAIEDLSEEFTMSQNFRWEAWLFRKFTKSDLALVIRYLRYRIRMGKREKESLLLRNLISNPDEFSENLSMAKSWSRAPNGHTDKQSVIKASGRSSGGLETQSVSAAQVIENHKQMAEMLKQWRAENL